MNQPLVSIIVPVYKVQQYIHRCIKTLCEQSLKDIEIILVDDGSPDDCPSICDYYAEKDKRIKVIHKVNEGLGYTRNCGISIATGKYIAFVDSDDFVSTNMYQILFEKAEATHSDVVFCNALYILPSGKEIPLTDFTSEHLYDGTQIKEIRKSFITSNTSIGKIISNTVWHGIYRTSLIKKNNIKFVSEREFPSEDRIFHLMLFEYVKSVVFIPDYLYYYCNNSQSIVNTFIFKKYELLNAERIKIISLFSSNKCTEDINAAYINQVFYYIKTLLRSRSITSKDKKKRIFEILHDQVWKEVSGKVQINHLNKSNRFFLFILNIKLFTILYYILIIYAYVKNSK